MPSRNPRLELGESWVVEGDDEYVDEETKDVRAQNSMKRRTRTALTKQVEDNNSEASSVYNNPPRSSPRQRQKRTTRSPDPEFIMPSLDSTNSDGSWVDTSNRNHRVQQGARRRAPRQTAPKSAIGKLNRSTIDRPDLSEAVFVHVISIASWTFNVFGKTLWFLTWPIAGILALWIFLGMSVVTLNLFTTSINTALSPICRIPGTQFLHLPFCPEGGFENIPSVEFDELMTVQSKFEDVLTESVGTITLPMDMKRGEASIRDLRQVIRYSDLLSKNELVLEFDDFIDNARRASYDLQKLNTHIGRAVDNVLSTTKWTTRVLDDIMIREVGRGTISSFFNDRLLAPFQPIRLTESVVLEQYIRHTETVEEEINRLITEGQALLTVLVRLEDRLDVIHGLVIKENVHLKDKKGEILSELWSVLGGNRGKINSVDRQLKLLQQTTVYRKEAYAHVANTILKLQVIASNLEDLRERVKAPELLRDRSDIPLYLHLENIQKGVERLEECRQTARRLEDESTRQTLESIYGQRQGQENLIDGR